MTTASHALAIDQMMATLRDRAERDPIARAALELHDHQGMCAVELAAVLVVALLQHGDGLMGMLQTALERAGRPKS